MIINRLTALGIGKQKKPGLHGDGGGLYLRVDKSLQKRWVFIFQWEGKRQEMGFGSLSVVGLADARDKRDQAHKLIANGVNPIEQKRIDKAKAAQNTFGDFATALIDQLELGWKNDKHRQQWRNTLTTYAAAIWDRQLDSITTQDVLNILTPIWITKAETASRVRARIEKVLDAAKAKGLRTGENPARWRGHLQSLLPPRQKLQRGHHPAMEVGKVNVFMKALAARGELAARLLEFTIATGVREGEALGARWEEIDLETKVWTIPATRMKAGREHRVPLNTYSIAALGERPEGGGLVFPGVRSAKPMSNMAMDMLLRRMKVTGATVHGFRSTFRDWAGDYTDYPREIIEEALAHSVGNAVERAYRRGNALEKRKTLMEDWSNFLTLPPPAPVAHS